MEYIKLICFRHNSYLISYHYPSATCLILNTSSSFASCIFHIIIHIISSKCYIFHTSPDHMCTQSWFDYLFWCPARMIIWLEWEVLYFGSTTILSSLPHDCFCGNLYHHKYNEIVTSNNFSRITISGNCNQIAIIPVIIIIIILESITLQFNMILILHSSDHCLIFNPGDKATQRFVEEINDQVGEPKNFLYNFLTFNPES